jgi:hypothetical protein
MRPLLPVLNRLPAYQHAWLVPDVLAGLAGVAVGAATAAARPY